MSDALELQGARKVLEIEPVRGTRLLSWPNCAHRFTIEIVEPGDRGYRR
jgi:hypothetical protein